jgi:hypothetical protein
VRSRSCPPPSRAGQPVDTDCAPALSTACGCPVDVGTSDPPVTAAAAVPLRPVADRGSPDGAGSSARKTTCVALAHSLWITLWTAWGQPGGHPPAAPWTRRGQAVHNLGMAGRSSVDERWTAGGRPKPLWTNPRFPHSPLPRLSTGPQPSDLLKRWFSTESTGPTTTAIKISSSEIKNPVQVGPGDNRRPARPEPARTVRRRNMSPQTGPARRGPRCALVAVASAAPGRAVGPVCDAGPVARRRPADAHQPAGQARDAEGGTP